MPLGRHTILTLAGGLVCAAQLGAQQPTGTIRGRVTDNATQQPISAVTVTVGSRAAQTQADGYRMLRIRNVASCARCDVPMAFHR